MTKITTAVIDTTTITRSSQPFCLVIYKTTSIVHHSSILISAYSVSQCELLSLNGYSTNSATVCPTVYCWLTSADTPITMI